MLSIIVLYDFSSYVLLDKFASLLKYRSSIISVPTLEGMNMCTDDEQFKMGISLSSSMKRIKTVYN